MTNENRVNKYNYLELSIGNTDFLILFGEDFHFREKPWFSPPHYHLFCESHFLKDGTFILKTDKENRVINGDALVVLPSRLMHTIESVISTVQKISFYIVITQNSINDYNTFSSYQEIFQSDTPFVWEKPNSVFSQIMTLVQTANSSEPLCEMKLKHLFSLGLIELFEQIGNINSQKTHENHLRYKDEMLLKIESFMLESFSPEATLEELADYLCLSTRQANRMLKQVFNCTFQEIKNQKRLDSAKKMIRDNEYSLTEIAEKLGYSSYTGFHKMFRIQTGMSPEEFRSSLE